VFGSDRSGRDTGDAIAITKNGKSLVRKRSPLGTWKGKVIIKENIISPIEVEWDAFKVII
jgi:hypothetical protein